MFKCSIEGAPAPTIIWYRDGDKLEERFNVKGDKKTIQIYPDGVLEISGMEFEDFGTYQCEASNVDRTRRSSTVEIVQNPNIGMVVFCFFSSRLLGFIDTVKICWKT